MSNALKAKVRADLKHSNTTKIRKSGGFPAVVYGANKQSKAIAVETVEFTKTIKDVGRNGIIELNIEGNEKEAVMLHDIQMDPIKNEVLHADFFIVDMSSKIDVEVNVHIIGEAKGVKEGGVLDQPYHQLHVRALPTDIPESIDIDVSDLEIGDTVEVKDLKTGRQYEILDDENTTVITIVPPTSEEVEDSGETQSSAENAESTQGTPTDNGDE
ncbi:50S ribosomal protein L25/general stress protein Ctc [Bacillus solimangrovi]|uniref:Large ribosomal subunit protein bL25 n=1 Tax=Bacillus solimangrovi TaxID=1305675 RepID=A0A1E5LEY2_9BACI|nr:50S ribosomal protein L25/general stress protein Ctc [Bacillus solimangrovi]OEH92632.1 50S ribosomal protein L25/general stress protein Ctc [Bacillus solimangrovi]